MSSKFDAVSNHLVDKWVREKSMVGVEHSFALLGFLAFLVHISIRRKVLFEFGALNIMNGYRF